MISRTACLQRLVQGARRAEKDHVGSDVVHDFNVISFAQTVQKLCCLGVGLLSKVFPQVIPQLGCHLRRQITVFGKQMPTPFAAQLEFP